MGHAGAIVSGSAGTAAAKQAALEAVGVRVGKTPSETARLAREVVTGCPPVGGLPGWGVRPPVPGRVSAGSKPSPPRGSP